MITTTNINIYIYNYLTQSFNLANETLIPRIHLDIKFSQQYYCILNRHTIWFIYMLVLHHTSTELITR